MTVRTSTRTVVFTRPFTLLACDDVQPAGRYVIETSEELLDVVSFPVWRRRSMTIRLRPRPGLTQTASIDPAELDAALLRDGTPVETRVESGVRQAHRVRMKDFFATAGTKRDVTSDAE